MKMSPDLRDRLAIAPDLTRRLLVEFIRNEARKFGFRQAGARPVSGGIDSALAAYLGAEAFGPENVFAIMMPYRTSSPESLAHAQLVVDDLGPAARRGRDHADGRAAVRALPRHQRRAQGQRHGPRSA